MKGFLILLSMLYPALSIAYSDVKVEGYYRSDGTYVVPHYRSKPNSTVNDNWSTYGNINPRTGEHGTKRVTDSILPSKRTQLHNNRKTESLTLPSLQTALQKQEPTKLVTGEESFSWFSLIAITFLLSGIFYYPFNIIGKIFGNASVASAEATERREFHAALLALSSSFLIALWIKGVF